ncbi:MAG TPA: transporter substrate-binding domain-containing protein [Pseudonocardiaceae bacterium]
MRRRSLVAILAVLGGVLALAGCGETVESPPQQAVGIPPVSITTTTPPRLVPGSPTYERIRQRGKLVVGVSPQRPGWAVRDTTSGEYTGFEVEIARLLARGLGVDPDKGVLFKPLPPNLRIEAVANGDVDLQIGGITAADAAGGRVELAGPYLVSAEGEHHIALPARDRALQAKITELLQQAVADGSWQQAYDRTLASVSGPATPPSLSTTATSSSVATSTSSSG